MIPAFFYTHTIDGKSYFKVGWNFDNFILWKLWFKTPLWLTKQRSSFIRKINLRCWLPCIRCVFYEARVIKNELGNYDYTKSFVLPIIRAQFSKGITHKELNSIAEILKQIVQLPPLTRHEKRSYPLLIRWFEKNWNTIRPIIPYITLLDSNFIPINHATESLYK